MKHENAMFKIDSTRYAEKHVCACSVGERVFIPVTKSRMEPCTAIWIHPKKRFLLFLADSGYHICMNFQTDTVYVLQTP